MKKNKIDRSITWVGQERSRAIKKILFCASLVISALFGWFIFDPISNIILQKDSITTEIPNTSENITTPPKDIVEPILPPPESSSESLNTVKLNDIYLLEKDDIITQSALQLTIDKLKAINATGVVIPIKNSNGEILYTIGSELADSTASNNTNFYDIEYVSNKFKENNLYIYSLIYAYEDRIYASQNRETGVKYMNSSVLWLDNYADMGGRAWLDPFSKKAQNYIIDIIKDITKYSDGILLASVQFPSGAALNKASFSGDISKKTTVLKEFIDTATKTAKDNGVVLYPVLSAYELLLKNGEYYGTEPFELTKGEFVLNIDMEDFKAGVITDKTTITSSTDVNEIIKAIDTATQPLMVMGVSKESFLGNSIYKFDG